MRRVDHPGWHARSQGSATQLHRLRDTPPTLVVESPVLPGCHEYSFQRSAPALPASRPAPQGVASLPAHPQLPRLTLKVKDSLHAPGGEHRSNPAPTAARKAVLVQLTAFAARE